YVHADAQVHPFEAGAYDLAVSRFGTMFFADRVAAFANVARALQPGGRILFVVWPALQAHTQFTMVMGTLALGRGLPGPPPGAPCPFALAGPQVGRADLEAAGFVDVEHTAVCEPFHAGLDADDALACARRLPMTQGPLSSLEPDQQQV